LSAQFTLADYRFGRDAGSALITVNTDGPADHVISLAYRTREGSGTARAGIDYPPVHGTLEMKRTRPLFFVADMSPYDPITFIGSSSGGVAAEVGGLCMSYEIAVAGQPHCFCDLFEMTPPRPWYLNRSLARGGDSGAWVINRGAGCRWGRRQRVKAEWSCRSCP
jgi:hypothetical protein